MIEAEWWDYEDADEMAEAVAGDIGFIIESALDARGEALIAVPGGKTPLPIYAKLVQAKLNWKKVTIIPTDDRLVPLTDERSNIRAIAQAFLPTGASGGSGSGMTPTAWRPLGAFRASSRSGPGKIEAVWPSLPTPSQARSSGNFSSLSFAFAEFPASL